MNKLALIAIIVLCISMTADTEIQRKRIRDGNFDIECYVYIKKLKKLDYKKEYYWFKSGAIHNTIANVGGLVLHDGYKKYYKSNQLLEKGSFNYGLKNDLWQTWYESGNIKSVTHWKDGYKDGRFLLYAENNELIQSGYYKANRRVNQWINYREKDTIFYKRDSVYSEKPKTKIGRLIDKVIKRKDSTERIKRKLERKNKRKQDSITKLRKKIERVNKRRLDSIKKQRQIIEKKRKRATKN